MFRMKYKIMQCDQFDMFRMYCKIILLLGGGAGGGGNVKAY